MRFYHVGIFSKHAAAVTGGGLAGIAKSLNSAVRPDKIQALRARVQAGHQALASTPRPSGIQYLDTIPPPVSNVRPIQSAVQKVIPRSAPKPPMPSVSQLEARDIATMRQRAPQINAMAPESSIAAAEAAHLQKLQSSYMSHPQEVRAAMEQHPLVRAGMHAPTAFGMLAQHHGGNMDAVYRDLLASPLQKVGSFDSAFLQFMRDGGTTVGMPFGRLASLRAG